LSRVDSGAPTWSRSGAACPPGTKQGHHPLQHRQPDRAFLRTPDRGNRHGLPEHQSCAVQVRNLPACPRALEVPNPPTTTWPHRWHTADPERGGPAPVAWTSGSSRPPEDRTGPVSQKLAGGAPPGLAPVWGGGRRAEGDGVPQRRHGRRARPQRAPAGGVLGWVLQDDVLQASTRVGEQPRQAACRGRPPPLPPAGHRQRCRSRPADRDRGGPPPTARPGPHTPSTGRAMPTTVRPSTGCRPIRSSTRDGSRLCGRRTDQEPLISGASAP